MTADCPRCSDWARLGLSSTCPDCDMRANNADIPKTPPRPDSHDQPTMKDTIEGIGE